MNGSEVLFAVFALATCGSAIAVVLSQNVVRMAFWLIMSLGSTSGLFFLLNADFIASAQLLVYVGGTLVLLIFGVMLTASGPFVSMKTNPGDAVLGGVVALALLGLLLSSAASVDWHKVNEITTNARRKPPGEWVRGYNKPEEGNSSRPLGLALLGTRVDQDLGAPEGRQSAGYLLPFEIVSVHLLVVLVGAGYLARAKRRVGEPRAPGSEV